MKSNEKMLAYRSWSPRHPTRRSNRKRTGLFEAVMFAVKPEEKKKNQRQTSKAMMIRQWSIQCFRYMAEDGLDIASSFLVKPDNTFYGAKPPVDAVLIGKSFIKNPWEEK